MTTYDTSTQSPNRADKPSYDLPNTYASQKNSFDKSDDDITQLKELLSERYCVIKKLGKGSQGAVYLA